MSFYIKLEYNEWLSYELLVIKEKRLNIKVDFVCVKLFY